MGKKITREAQIKKDNQIRIGLVSSQADIMAQARFKAVGVLNQMRVDGQVDGRAGFDIPQIMHMFKEAMYLDGLISSGKKGLVLRNIMEDVIGGDAMGTSDHEWTVIVERMIGSLLAVVSGNRDYEEDMDGKIHLFQVIKVIAYDLAIESLADSVRGYILESSKKQSAVDARLLAFDSQMFGMSQSRKMEFVASKLADFNPKAVGSMAHLDSTVNTHKGYTSFENIARAFVQFAMSDIMSIIKSNEITFTNKNGKEQSITHIEFHDDFESHQLDMIQEFIATHKGGKVYVNMQPPTIGEDLSIRAHTAFAGQDIQICKRTSSEGNNTTIAKNLNYAQSVGMVITPEDISLTELLIKAGV